MSTKLYESKRKGIAGTVWINDSNSYSVSICKSYLDKKTNKWLETKSYFDNELPLLMEVVEDCRNFVINNNAKDLKQSPAMPNNQDSEEIPF